MLSDYQEKIIWSEHSSKPTTQLVQFFCLVRHFLKSFSGRASLIQKLQCCSPVPRVNLAAIPTYCPRGFDSPDLWHALGKKHALRSPQTCCITVEWTFSPLLSAAKQWQTQSTAVYAFSSAPQPLPARQTSQEPHSAMQSSPDLFP